MNTELYLTTVKTALPESEFSPLGVLINRVIDREGKPDYEESKILSNALDVINMPSILVRKKFKKDPIEIQFEWFNKNRHEQSVSKNLYEKLGVICAGKKCLETSWHLKAKPFKNAGSEEIIYGFKTIDEAIQMADRMMIEVHLIMS